MKSKVGMMRNTMTVKKTRLATAIQQFINADMKRKLAIVCLSATLPFSAMAQEQAKVDDIEVIEVTGMLGSMKASALIKRTDGRIVDAIVAEDIGKLPDNNIAEALQRITGVSINTDFGVGDSISIRGLPQNRVELNGRSTIGDSRDGISLQDFPSSFLKAVEVVKSPTADMIEGALGGTVSLRTVRPLELEKLTAAFSLDGEYADKTEHWAPIFSGSIGNNWNLGDSGTFGVLAMLSYQDREIRQDEYFNRVKLYDDDVNGLSANTPSGKFAVRDQNTVQQFVEERERTAMNLSLQWAPASAKGMFYLDLNATERSGSQEGVSILDVGGSRTYDANATQDSNGQVNNYTLPGVFVIPKTFSEFRETDSYSHALGGEWNISDDILISGEISVASSSSYAPDSEFTLRPISRETGGTHTIDASFNQSGDEIPSIIYSDPLALISPDNLALRTFQHDARRTENDETAVRFDVVMDEPLDFTWLTKVKAGIRATKREYGYTDYDYQAKDLYKNARFDADDSLAIMWIDEFNALFPNSFNTMSHPNSFDQSGLSGQMDLLTYAAYSGLSDASGTFDKVQQILQGTNLATTGSLADNLEHDEGAYRDITEDTAAIYVSAYLDFDDITAIIGGRYIQTDIESSVYVDGSIVSGKHDYSDFLPSLNVTYNYSDDTVVRFAAAKVMRRADFGQLSPAFEIDSSAVTASQGAIDLAPHRATQYDLSVEHYFGEGNMVSFAVFYKDVESFLNSETTCRASAATATQNVTEWENVCLLDSAGADNANLVYSSSDDFDDAAGLTHTEGLRDAGLTGIVTDKDTNGENGTVQGFEIGYQQHFDFLPGAWSGLGLSANYTYADSEQPNGNALLDISKNTYNLQLFWEHEQIALRLAYNYRDKFLASEKEKRVATIGALALNSSTSDESSPLYDSTAGNNYREDRGQLDFSASWEINEHFTFVANATNLTGEPSVFSTELGSSWKYTEADRRYTLGVRAKF